MLYQKDLPIPDQGNLETPENSLVISLKIEQFYFCSVFSLIDIMKFLGKLFKAGLNVSMHSLFCLL